MEARVMGEVSRAVTGMSRKQANEIVLCCLQQYEPTLGNPPRGKRMQDLYDMEQLKPKDEWLKLYESVKAELKEWGAPLR
jgi:methylamine---corrinoid protein Co-methyltransferase